MNNDHTLKAKEPWELGTKISGVDLAFQPVPLNILTRDKLREKRKLRKLETARKRGLLDVNE